ncbi:MAG: hypothetical protein M3501_02695 [Actinomycetota bacterium]|nr:hypothetical protein [Actinomycetota bacterium]
MNRGRAVPERPEQEKPVETAAELIARHRKDAADAALLRGELEAVLDRWRDIDPETVHEVLQDVALVAAKRYMDLSDDEV